MPHASLSFQFRPVAFDDGADVVRSFVDRLSIIHTTCAEREFLLSGKGMQSCGNASQLENPIFKCTRRIGSWQIRFGLAKHDNDARCDRDTTERRKEERTIGGSVGRQNCKLKIQITGERNGKRKKRHNCGRCVNCAVRPDQLVEDSLVHRLGVERGDGWHNKSKSRQRIELHAYEVQDVRRYRKSSRIAYCYVPTCLCRVWSLVFWMVSFCHLLFRLSIDQTRSSNPRQLHPELLFQVVQVLQQWGTDVVSMGSNERHGHGSSPKIVRDPQQWESRL
jgi:hypothetical protein